MSINFFNKGNKKKSKDMIEERDDHILDDNMEENEAEFAGDDTDEYIADLEHQVQESKDKYLRLFAEFDNYKKRTIKESLELRKTASRDLITDLLPVLDDFERAKRAAEDENSKEYFSEGVSLVYNKLKSLLEHRGLTPMESDGESFDPEFHEALTEIPAPSEEMKGKVIDTIERGYLLNDRIIRHAKVVVGR